MGEYEVSHPAGQAGNDKQLVRDKGKERHWRYYSVGQCPPSAQASTHVVEEIDVKIVEVLNVAKDCGQVFPRNDRAGLAQVSANECLEVAHIIALSGYKLSHNVLSFLPGRRWTGGET